MSTSQFWRLGNQLTCHDDSRSTEIGRQRFREFFGIPPELCSIVWNELYNSDAIPVFGQPHHLLWALLFLKRYFTEHVMSAVIGHDEKTIRKWVWIFVHLLSTNLTPVIYLNL